MTLLAETTEGMHNLFRLASLSSLEGYFRKPRMDRELLARYAKGIIATTGCPGSEVQTRLRLGQERQALEAAAAYRDIFGADNFFVELMDHGLDVERRSREGLRRIAKDLSLPYVATNDLHYAREADAVAHEALLCVQTATNLADPNRFRLEGTSFYVKSPQEMRAANAEDDWQAGCDTTLLIAERTNVEFTKSNLMPRGSLARDGPSLSGRVRRAAPPPGGVRDQRDRADGVLLVLPGRRGLHHVGEAERDPGGAVPRLGGRLDRVLRARYHRPGPDISRPGLRTLPEPRACVHARR
jgi:hypothetical protein